MPFVSTSVFTSATAQDVYLIVKGKIQSKDPIKGVMSCTQLDAIQFDKDTYRNELSAAYIGRPWLNLVKSVGGIAGDLIFGPQGIQDGAGKVNDLDIGGTDTQSQIPDDVTDHDDPYNGTEPFSTPKKQSLYLFWDGANGTGSVLAMCNADEFTELSIQPSQSIF